MCFAPFQKNESSFILNLAGMVVKGRGRRLVCRMSGILNGYSRSFYRYFCYFWPFERRFERLKPLVLPLILTF